MLIENFIKIWKTEDKTNEVMTREVDLLVPICYGMSTRESLSIMTKLNYIRAINLLQNFPKATLAFGNCPYIFPGAEVVERRLKHELTPIPDNTRVLEVTIINSVDEAEKIKTASEGIGLKPKCILILTGELHSRSARYIWQKVFPDSKILILCISSSYEFEPNHIVLVQRTLGSWVFANLARHLLLLIFGLSIRNLHHKIEKAPN